MNYIKREYVRDGRAPIPKNELTSRIMSAIRGKNTKPEIMFRKALYKNNIRGYRVHWKKAVGNPDIAFVSKKIAIFVHGCFWHRCPHCHPHVPKSHSYYWQDKFNKNVQRDIRYQEQLKKLGWETIVIWECQIKNDIKKCISRTKKILKKILL